MSPIVIDDRPRCPTCGHLVNVFSADDGTSHYEPDEREVEATAPLDVERLAARLTRASVAVHEAGWSYLQRLGQSRRVEWADCEDERCAADRAALATTGQEQP